MADDWNLRIAAEDGKCCGNCVHFMCEDSFGIGLCGSRLRDVTYCGYVCDDFER